MFKKRYLFLTLALISSGLMAMEQPEVTRLLESFPYLRQIRAVSDIDNQSIKEIQMPSQGQFQKPGQTIAIRGTDGNVIGVPEYIARQSVLIEGYLHYAQEESAPEGEKEYSSVDKTSEGKTFDFTLGQFCEDGGNAGKADLDLSAETLKTVFNCIAHKREIKKLDKESLIRVFEVGHYLGAPQKIMRKLTLHAQNILSHDEQPELVQCSHYLNSIRSLYNSGALKVLCHVRHNNDNDIDYADLVIHDQKIDMLDGIALLAKEYENVCVVSLNLNKNKLKNLDVAQLREHFPFLRKFFASENVIESLVLPRELEYEFWLFLNNNQIKDLPSFKAGEHSYVDLTNNPLSTESKQIALRATLPTLLEGQRHRIKALMNKYTLMQGLKGLGEGIGTFSLGLGIGGFAAVLWNKYMDPEISFYDLAYKALNTLSSGATPRFACLGFTAFWGGLELGMGYSRMIVAQHQFIPGQVKFDQDPENV